MLVHSRTLYHLYPEQLWLDNLQLNEETKEAVPANLKPQPVPHKPTRTTTENLRKLEGIEKSPTVFEHIKDFLDMYKAA